MSGAVIMHTRPVELVEIAKRIHSAIKVTAESIVDVGKDLADAKRMLHQHGAWLSWLDSEFQMSARTAQRYMQAAEFAKGKYDTVSLLPPATIYLLSAPSTPEKIKAEVLADLKAKKPVDHRVVESKIKEARQAAEKAKVSKLQREARSEPQPSISPPPTAETKPKPSSPAQDTTYACARRDIKAAILKAIDGFPSVSPFTVIDALNDVQSVLKIRAQAVQQ
jgi:hypothetical protein